MKYVVSAYTQDTDTGSVSEADEWTFESLGAARIFFDGYDIVHYFEVEAKACGRMAARNKRFVIEIAECEDGHGSGQVMDMKTADVSDID